MKNSLKDAFLYVHEELFHDESFLLRVCEMRGYEPEFPERVGWLSSIADVKLSVLYAVKKGDERMAHRAIQCKDVIANSNTSDIAIFVIFALNCDILKSEKDFLLSFLVPLSRSALCRGFCSKATTDLSLAQALLPQNRPVGPSPSPSTQLLSLPPPPTS